MSELDSNLFKVISICNGDFNFFEHFYKMYTFTTENISGYLKYFDLDGKSLLTVGS